MFVISWFSFIIFSLGDEVCLLFFFPFLFFPDFDLEDESKMWISAVVSKEDSPFGETGKVIIGEVTFEGFFLLLVVLTELITPSVAWDLEGVVVI